LALAETDIQTELNRRRPGQSRYTSQRQEEDAVQITSGVFEGYTTGAPIGLWVKNTQARSRDYEAFKDVFRPGHADYTYHLKYGHRDHRGGGRASARETVLWVAAGAVAKKYLQLKTKLKIKAYVSQIGPISAKNIQIDCAEQNPFFFPDPDQITALENLITTLRRQRDSIGARIQAMIQGVPPGLGEPVFDKLSADIAKALMSIPAVKGIEIGDGFNVVTQKGSENRDPLTPSGFLSNHAGGLLGGISTGQDILLSLAIKPTSSVPTPITTIDKEFNQTAVSVTGRHDPCVGIRAVPVVEALLNLVLMDHYLRGKAYSG
jgi:chorismate synthase